MPPGEDAIQIRRAAEGDIPILASHRADMFRDMGSVRLAVVESLRAAAESHIREAMAAGEYVAWVAHDPVGTRVVGGAGVQIRRLLARPDRDGQQLLIGREGIVLNVYVDRHYRRRGLARRLMETILAWVPTTDIVQLVLHASADGKALYEEMGFAPTNEYRYGKTLR